MNTKTKALLAFAGLFIAGFATGFLFSNALSPSESEYAAERAQRLEGRERWQRGERSGRSERQAERTRARLSELLDLSSEQQDPFFELMSEYRTSLRSEIREMRNREHELVKEHYEALKNDLSAILNQQQLEKLDNHLHPDSVRHHRLRGVRPGRPSAQPPGE